MGMKMGEGWLLTAEMLELIDEGVRNIVCAQPFGCLPNHIVGKGMMKPIRAASGSQSVAIDYDARRYADQWENRIKLMLANANARAPEGGCTWRFPREAARFFMGRYARNDAFCTARY